MQESILGQGTETPMPKDIFEQHLETIQSKRLRKEQRASFRRIDAEIKKLSDAWIGCIMQDMEVTISQETDPVQRKTMEEGMGSFLEGFEAGYYAGWLRQRADEA